MTDRIPSIFYPGDLEAAQFGKVTVKSKAGNYGEVVELFDQDGCLCFGKVVEVTYFQIEHPSVRRWWQRRARPQPSEWLRVIKVDLGMRGMNARG